MFPAVQLFSSVLAKLMLNIEMNSGLIGKFKKLIKKSNQSFSKRIELLHIVK